MSELRNYCGSAFKKCSFMTFGNHDMRILNQSVSYNLDTPKDIVKQIHTNYIDFSVLISEFIRDDNGNPLSLVHYCELFDVKEAGVAHDPRVDAINLMNLYDAFLEKKDIVLERYKDVLKRGNSHLPKPVMMAINALASGQDVTAEQFENNLKEYLD